MKKHIATIAVLLGIAAFCSCTKEYDPDPEFISGDTVCLKVEGKTILTYNADSWQASYRTNAIQYRVFSDDNKDYYKLVCSEKPETAGQKITGTLTWQTSASSALQKKEKVNFTVQRIDAETGAISLWSSKSNIGVTVIQAE